MTENKMLRVPRNYLLYLCVVAVFGVCWLWLSRIVPRARVPAVGTQNNGASFERWEKEIRNETLGFQKILCINLPERTDRFDAMRLAATASDMDLYFVDGIRGEMVSDRVLPLGAEKVLLSLGQRGKWRAHMDALLAVVQENLTTALIVEDDVDWDVRIKSQLVQFARGASVLTQPLRGSRPGFADPSFPNPNTKVEADSSQFEIDMADAPETVVPSDSPYGDSWDVLWLGHCGTKFPEAGSWPSTPLGRAVFRNDDTVPQTQHLGAYSHLAFEYSTDELQQTYPNHTRVVHHAAGTSCSLAYAVNQRSARRLLYELGLKKLNAQFDLMLSQYCDGKDGRQYHNCLTVQPALIKSHQPAGLKSSLSDVSTDDDDGMVLSDPFTNHIRVSTRINLSRLLEGTPTLVDSFPDDEPPTNFDT
ncbi:hypothetical protein NA57DRAFT_71005 [Rhizodiscina lignyota]|uniref:Glycosyltransferase family 25 protein n=1 Tax=Rhizodiscina lignyota TaxID=1504668 RepID=A0A9P4MGT6_9PEZI|nr:hypothetical protein NA57DRAFT_71005 [Rhizodiscina lignyota]